MTKLFCKMCREKASSLRGLRNYSTAFIDGISGSALKTALSTEKKLLCKIVALLCKRRGV